MNDQIESELPALLPLELPVTELCEEEEGHQDL